MLDLDTRSVTVSRPTASSATPGLSVVVIGSGGAGAITVGSLLLAAAARTGLFGLMTRSVGPQIRGGEAAAMVRLSRRPVHAHDDGYDLVVALDWRNADRFADEIPLGAGALVIGDEGADAVPAAFVGDGIRNVTLPLGKTAEDLGSDRANLVALGLIATLIGLPRDAVAAAIVARLSGRDVDASAAQRILDAAEALAKGLPAIGRLDVPAPGDPKDPAEKRWLISGNQAAALGCIRAGIRFAAMYPITPATDMLEWMAPRLAKLGGQLIQAEDEIAALGMVVGAGYAGVPAMTATSGPGLALMTETIGLAVAAEVPAVIIDVMRGGPSTGIPTKSEQADLNIALYGLHGDAPHLVLAPLSVEDCTFTAAWATHLSVRLQTPAIVLSDQFLGQALSVMTPMADTLGPAAAATGPEGIEGYLRYRDTPSGVSPMVMPGTPGGQYTADGLEHDAAGVPSSRAADHLAQLDKRRRKLESHDYGDGWALIDGGDDAQVAIMAFGSVVGAVLEAAERLRAGGLKVRIIAPRLLLPTRPVEMASALNGVGRILVVEQTHSGQFATYLKGHYDLGGETRSLCRPGPLPWRPGEVVRAIEQWEQQP